MHDVLAWMIHNQDLYSFAFTCRGIGFGLVYELSIASSLHYCFVGMMLPIVPPEYVLAQSDHVSLVIEGSSRS